MQYHLNGVTSGDPRVQTARPDAPRDNVDVLIVGTGPTGLTLAAQLSAFPDLNIRIIERKSGPLELGQADGVACRSVEMFEAFGFAERAMQEAYWVNETTFWNPAPENPRHIHRSGRIQDVEDGLSEMPHLILSQARIHDFYLEIMKNSAARLVPDYNHSLDSLTVEPDHDYPVRVQVSHTGTPETLRARYVVGCDGARSAVRQAIGRRLRGESANQAWGVMDVLAVTDFPDIRFKSVIRSAGHGTIVLIPREGGYLARFYIELDTLSKTERARDRDITIDMLIKAANDILHPYNLDVKDVAWWSVYEIGQRLTDSFRDDSGHVFIAGDACHTHSPKAGQGMNVSMADAFNLGWKLAAVLRGQACPALLDTYSSERQSVAEDLIAFDKHWARRFSEGGTDAATFQTYFSDHGRYTAGVAVTYAPSLIQGTADHQHLARGWNIGTRFHSAPVVRVWDAKRMHLGHALKADGRWRLLAMADASNPADRNARLWQFCDAIEPVCARFTPKGQDSDAVIDLRAVFQHGHRDFAAEDTHPILTPTKGSYGLQDREKMFVAASGPDPDIFDIRGVDRTKGCLLILRPDQFVAHVLPLDRVEAVEEFFANVLLPTQEEAQPRSGHLVRT
jgi:phenol 2-monooxygenase